MGLTIHPENIPESLQSCNRFSKGFVQKHLVSSFFNQARSAPPTHFNESIRRVSTMLETNAAHPFRMDAYMVNIT